jgi:hypothetical protein
MPPLAQDPCWRPAVFRPAPSAPARSVRVSHDSDPTSGHDPRPKPKPLLLPDLPPIPNPYAPTGRRGRKDGARLSLLPTVDHHGQRARLFVAPQPKPLAATNLCSRYRSPSHLAAPAAWALIPLISRPLHQARLLVAVGNGAQSCSARARLLGLPE